MSTFIKNLCRREAAEWMIYMTPFKLAPAFKDYLWGGAKLKTLFGKETALDPVAESWELSAHPDGDCHIDGGPLHGTAFSAFARTHPALLGSNCAGFSEFPVLIKLIDAKQSLSIQVHPDDGYARRVEHGAGKTEMWVVLESEPDAFLYFGFDREVSQEEMRRRIEDDTITDVLCRAPVKPGDVFFIRAGTIHAIGAGILLAEIQQNSNTTYRVYDFGRLGPDGAPRALHVDKALEVTETRPADRAAPGQTAPTPFPGGTLQTLASCTYFTTERVTLAGEYERKMDGGSFVSLLCTEGGAALDCGGSMAVRKGDSVFVPADNSGFTLTGTGQFLLTTI